MDLDLSVGIEDLNEIEDNYEGLSSWLVNNLTSFPACAFVLETIMREVRAAKKQLSSDNTND